MRRPKALAVVAGVVLGVSVSARQQTAAQAPAGQQQPPTFKSGTQVVEVDVRVFDKDGHFVTGLTPDDFIIKEDGSPQPIVALTFVGPSPNPSPNPNGNPVNPVNPATSAPRTSPSTWVFVFDTLHLSDAGLHNTRKSVIEFLQDRFHDGDIGGVIVDGKMVNNRLTSVREELVKDVDTLKLPDTTFAYQRTMRREWPPIQDEFEAWRIADQGDPQALQQATQRACTMDPDMCRTTSPDGAVRAKAANIMTQAHASTLLSLRVVEGLSNGLARMAGPKTVVYVSDGFVVQGAEDFVRDATGMANRAGAHFYTFDARGLNKGSASSDIIDQKLAFDSAGAFGGFDMQADGTNALAVDTGGIPIRNENNFGRALDLIQKDAETYYVLGYTPSNQTFDGKYRRIDVSVKRDGVHVRARRGYLALEPAKLLRPTTIATTPEVSTAQVVAPPAGYSGNPEEPARPDPADAFVAPTPKTPAPDATSVRTRIEKGGLVAGLPGEGAAPADDPASRGWAAYQQGDVETAARELKQASRSPGAHPWVSYVLGFCELALERYPDAASSWEAVRAASPAFEPVYFNLADAYIGQGADGRAYAILDDAATRWPGDPEIYDAEGVIQIRAHAYDDAIESFQQATKLAPNDPVGWFNLASAHHANYLHMHGLMSNPRRFIEESRERGSAIDAYHKVIALRGQYVDESRRGLRALGAK